MRPPPRRALDTLTGWVQVQVGATLSRGPRSLFGRGSVIERRTAAAFTLTSARDVAIAVARDRHRLLIELALDELFDFGEQFAVVGRYERDRSAAGTRATGAADAVHVVFGHERQLVVHYRRQLIDVEAARRRRWRPGSRGAVLEASSAWMRSFLRFVAVNGIGGKPSRASSRARRAVCSLEREKTSTW